MTGTIVETDQDLLRSIVRSFLADFVDNDYLNEQESSAHGYEPARWKQLCAMGWTAVNLPARVGGGDGSLTEAALIARECGRAAYASPLLQTIRAATLLATLNQGERFDRVLSDIADGAPAALVAPPDRTIVAVADDDGCRVRGSAIVEWLAQCTMAVLLLPRTDNDRWVCAVVPQGHLKDRIVAKLSTDNERCARLDFDGCHLPNELIVTDSICMRDAELAFGRANLLRASTMIGGCERVLEFSAQYARERHQFGKPIGAFQAAQHLLARMAIAVDAASLACDEALALAEAEDIDGHASAMASVALFIAGRSYVDVVLNGAQIHGGIGTTVEHILHHHYRRAKAMQLRNGKRANRLRELFETLVISAQGSLW